jgi:hypothetical protein
VNANGKLLDVWLLIGCVRCDRTSKIDNVPEPLEVFVRFELPAPIRVEKLLMAGFGLSRSAVKRMVDSGRIRLPMAVDARARADFTLQVSGPSSHAPGPSRSSEK